jgi:hypothetical protein
MGSREWFLLVILSLLWGGSFTFSKVTLSELQPFTVVLGRVSIAAIALNTIARAACHLIKDYTNEIEIAMPEMHRLSMTINIIICETSYLIRTQLSSWQIEDYNI